MLYLVTKFDTAHLSFSTASSKIWHHTSLHLHNFSFHILYTCFHCSHTSQITDFYSNTLDCCTLNLVYIATKGVAKARFLEFEETLLSSPCIFLYKRKTHFSIPYVGFLQPTRNIVVVFFNFISNNKVIYVYHVVGHIFVLVTPFLIPNHFGCWTFSYLFFFLHTAYDNFQTQIENNLKVYKISVRIPCFL